MSLKLGGIGRMDNAHDIKKLLERWRTELEKETERQDSVMGKLQDKIKKLKEEEGG